MVLVINAQSIASCRRFHEADWLSRVLRKFYDSTNYDLQAGQPHTAIQKQWT